MIGTATAPRLETVSFGTRKQGFGFLNLNLNVNHHAHARDLQMQMQMKSNRVCLCLCLRVKGVGGEILTNGHAAGAGKHTHSSSELCTPASTTTGNGNGNSTNIHWHSCSVEKHDRQKLLDKKGCVIWITGLSASGKSTVACALSQILHRRGKLSYVLDGDNVRHGLNKNLGFKAEDRAENIRRVGEVAKLFADAGVICIASLISPYRRDRDACRALLPNGDFIEVFMDVPLHICEARDPKGLYKLARAGKINGIDDPYEAPINSEIVLKHGEPYASPAEMAEKVAWYLEDKGYLQA